MPSREEYRTKATKFRKQRREYYYRNQTRARAASREWRRRNRKHHRAYQRKYFRKHRTEARLYQKAWYRENRDSCLQRASEWARKHPIRRKEIGRKWENSAKGRLDKQRRTAHRRALLKSRGSFTTAQWDQTIKSYRHRCAGCGRKRNLQLHHVLPLSQGGLNVISNIQPLCKQCHTQVHRDKPWKAQAE